MSDTFVDEPPAHDQPDAPGPTPVPAAGRKRGVCSVCGEKARTPTATQCAKHTTEKARKRERQRRDAPKRSAAGSLRGDLTGQLAMVGGFWQMRTAPIPRGPEAEFVFGDLPPEVIAQLRTPAEVLIEQADAIAGALVALGEQNHYVKSALEAATTGAPILMLVNAVGPIYQAHMLYKNVALPRMQAAAAQMADAVPVPG